MLHGYVLGGLHDLVGMLLYPVVFALVVALGLILWEVGYALAERCYTLAQYRRRSLDVFERYAVRRLERADLLARTGPILGLMGTLIPLGPGLAALGEGDLDVLATALIVAFDTTVLGLLIGLLGFVIGRIRRRWYDSVWHQLQELTA